MTEKAVKVVLVRHGSAALDLENLNEVYNYTRGIYDPVLSEEGIEGVKVLWDKIPAVKFWFTSPKWRAYMTTLLLGGNLKRTGLLDIADYTDISIDIVEEYIKRGFDDVYIYSQWFQTEGYRKTVDRVGAAWELLKNMVIGEGNIGIVSHDEILRMLICIALGRDIDEFASEDLGIKRGEAVVINFDDDSKVIGIERL